MSSTGLQYFPMTLPPNTVIGRLSGGPGPTEAIPFSTLAALLVTGGSPAVFSTTTVLLTTYPASVVLTNGQIALTLGRDVEGYGGGAFYYVASDTTSADNGGTTRVDTQGRRWYAVVGAEVDARLFGAKFDTAQLQAGAGTGVSISVSSNILFCALPVFKPADVGKVWIGAIGAAGANVFTTITGYTDAQHVTLGVTAATALTAGFCTYGTDDTTALQAAITWAQGVTPDPAQPAYPTITIRFPDADTLITGGLVLSGSTQAPPSLVSNNARIWVAFNTVGAIAIQSTGTAPAFFQGINIQGQANVICWEANNNVGTRWVRCKGYFGLIGWRFHNSGAGFTEQCEAQDCSSVGNTLGAEYYCDSTSTEPSFHASGFGGSATFFDSNTHDIGLLNSSSLNGTLVVYNAPLQMKGFLAAYPFLVSANAAGRWYGNICSENNVTQMVDPASSNGVVFTGSLHCLDGFPNLGIPPGLFTMAGELEWAGSVGSETGEGIFYNAQDSQVVQGDAAATILSAAGSGVLVKVSVNGINQSGAGDRFEDVVTFFGGGTATVVTGPTLTSPGTRTYTVSGNNLQLALSGGNAGSYLIYTKYL